MGLFGRKPRYSYATFEAESSGPTAAAISPQQGEVLEPQQAESGIALDDHTAGVTYILEIPGTNWVATACHDKVIRIFDARTGTMISRLNGHEGILLGLTTLGDNLLASFGDGHGKTMRIWDIATSSCLGHKEFAEGKGVRVAPVARGRFILSTGNIIISVTHNAGQQLQYTSWKSIGHSEDITDVAASGRKIATASLDKTAAVWDEATQRPLAKLVGHRHGVMRVVINDSHVATGSQDESVRIYNLSQYQCIRVLHGVHSSWVAGVCLLGNSLFASFGGRSAVIADIATGDIKSLVSLDFETWHGTVLRDGRCAAVGVGGKAFIFPPPERTQSGPLPSGRPPQPSVHPPQPSVRPSQPSVRPSQPSVLPPQPSVYQPQPSVSAGPSSIDNTPPRQAAWAPNPSTPPRQTSAGVYMMNFVSSLPAIAVGQPEGAIVSSVALVIFGMRFVYGNIKLLHQNPRAAQSLVYRLQPIELCLKRIANAPSHATSPGLLECILRLGKVLDSISQYTDQVLREEIQSDVGLLERAKRFARSHKVAEQLVEFERQVSAVLFDITAISSIDANALIAEAYQAVITSQNASESRDRRLSRGIEALAGVLAGAGGTIYTIRNAMERVVESVREQGIRVIVSELEQIRWDELRPEQSRSSSSSTLSDDYIPDEEEENALHARERLRNAVEVLLQRINDADENDISAEDRQFASDALRRMWEPWRRVSKDDLEFGRELGSGAGGAVFKAKWNAGGGDGGEPVAVAVKKFQVSFRRQIRDQQRAQFEREAEIMRDCSHPCVLELIGMIWPDPKRVRRANVDAHVHRNDDEDDGSDDSSSEEDHTDSLLHAYLVTELMGTSVSNAIDTGRLPRPECRLVVLRDVACGMEHLHSKGIAHLDLKPQNVLVNIKRRKLQGRAKICDFGTSRKGNLEESSQTLASHVGTLMYLAPEMYVRPRASRASDVYSFGVMICVLLGDEREIMMYRQREASYDARREMVLQGTFYKLIARCVESLPDDRLKRIAEACLRNQAGPSARQGPPRGRGFGRPTFGAIAVALQKLLEGESVQDVLEVLSQK